MNATRIAAMCGTGHTSYPTQNGSVTIGPQETIEVVQSVWAELYPHRPYWPAQAFVELQRNPDAQRRIREAAAAYAVVPSAQHEQSIGIHRRAPRAEKGSS